MATTTETQGEWSEPETPYGKIKGEVTDNLYPYNKVYESESGHLIEVDDTPGSERIDVFHRTGTFEEFHPNGDRVTKVVRDRYTSVLRDDYIHIDGFCNMTVDKAMKIVVNHDDTESTPAKNVNFDIEVGRNANVNLLIKKGNCNLKLEEGDVNLLMNQGDVNIRQEKGNYNHFINGDYNLEVTGKMHTVVGKDVVNEIGGNRDIRVDGDFDNKWITKGYSETFVEKGDMRIEVGANHHQLIHGESHLKVEQGRRTFIDQYEELSVSGPTKIKVAQGDLDIFTDGNIAISSSGTFDGSFTGATKITSDSSIDVFAATTAKIYSTSSMEVLSQGPMKLNGSSSVDILSGASMRISSGALMGINASGALLQTGSVIHLNGPSAPRAASANRAATAGSASLPDKSFVYTPGAIGSWSKTVNGKTPASALTGAVNNLSKQLETLDAAKTQLSGASGELGGLKQELAVAGNDPGKLTNIASSTATLTNNVSGVTGSVDGVANSMGGTVDSVKDVAGGVVPGSADALNKYSGDGDFLSNIKSGIGGIAGFVGDIFGTITDIACGIIDAIGGVLDAVGKVISDAIGAVMDAIGSVIDAIGSVIDSLAKAIADVIGTITDIIGQVFDAAGKFIGGIIDGIGSVIDAIASIFDGLGGRPKNCGISLALCVDDVAVGVSI
jgi:hypothetical protein